MKLTDEQRQQLADELATLKDAERKVLNLRKPFDDLLWDLDKKRDQVLERYGVASLEVHHCETCDALLIEGDLVHEYADGPIFCAEHALTWGDIQREAEEMTDDDDAEAEEGETRTEKLAAVQAHVDAGGTLDDKVVHQL